MENTLLTQNDWAAIDGRLCLVTGFVPLLAKVESGRVRAIDWGTPYASVRLKCEDSTQDISGFICHKTDLAMLWAAFNKRTEVPGTRLEVLAPEELNPDALGENEEVWLVWTRKNYRATARLFGRLLPKLRVIISRKGAFELAVRDDLRPDLRGVARAEAIAPLAMWTPKVMQ